MSLNVIALAAAALLAPVRLHQPDTVADRFAAVSIPFQRYRLANGLEVILHPDDLVPRVYVGVLYHVGSGNEPPGKSGLAHLIEHVMFRGSQHVGAGRHHDIIRAAGGVANATTTTDRTLFFQEVPTHQLETALWLESDRMGYLLPALTDATLSREREVVRNERRQSFEITAYGKGMLEVSRLLFADGHPYRYLAIGRHEDVARADLEDVQRFFRRWYVPANATLVIAGDFAIERARGLIDRWFGTFPRSDRPDQPPTAALPVTGAIRQEIQDDVAEFRRVHYAWHTPRAFEKGDVALDVVAQILGRPGTGRLARRLAHERLGVRQVLVAQKSRSSSSVFHLAVDLQPGVDLPAVERVIDEELEALRRTPVSSRELGRVLTNIETSYVGGLESLAARGELLQTYNHFIGDPGGYVRHLDALRRTQATDVQEAVRQYLGPRNRVAVLTVPRRRAAGAERHAPAVSLEAW